MLYIVSAICYLVFRNSRTNPIQKRIMLNPLLNTNKIPILVIAHSRYGTLRQLLHNISAFRDPTKSPLVVSIDSGIEKIVRLSKSIADQTLEMKNVSLIGKYPSNHIGYAKISQHYYWALEQIFGNQTLGASAVIILEDDLRISPDIFDYFYRMFNFMEICPNILCASAWNDNGKAGKVSFDDPYMLHLTDFFPGLGWLLHRKIWDEFKYHWPNIYWDDWLREPAQRKGRLCVRPEVSRTAASPADSATGVSNGEFFDSHISKVQLLDAKVAKVLKWSSYDLTQLNDYDSLLTKRMERCKKIKTIEQIEQGMKCARIEYHNDIELVKLLRSLDLMEDFKAGIARTSYKGIVQTVLNGVRLYLEPVFKKV